MWQQKQQQLAFEVNGEEVLAALLLIIKIKVVISWGRTAVDMLAEGKTHITFCSMFFVSFASLACVCVNAFFLVFRWCRLLDHQIYVCFFFLSFFFYYYFILRHMWVVSRCVRLRETIHTRHDHCDRNGKRSWIVRMNERNASNLPLNLSTRHECQ